MSVLCKKRQLGKENVAVYFFKAQVTGKAIRRLQQVSDPLLSHPSVVSF